jgi:hypothetical protein
MRFKPLMMAKRIFSVRKKAKRRQNIFSDAVINFDDGKTLLVHHKKSKLIAKVFFDAPDNLKDAKAFFVRLK